MLIAVENGVVNQWKGKQLADISVEGNELITLTILPMF